MGRQGGVPMKIGAVSQATGLTDRTIRYYIEEGLLQPEFTKNYTGRKSFDFTQEHVTLLHQISVLRKYGFSITDIKTILEDPSQSSEITQELIEKKKQTIQTEQMLLDTLLQLDKQKDYTLPELADALDSPVLADVKVPKDSEIPLVTRIFQGIFWCAWVLAMLFYLFCIFAFTKSNIEDFLYVKFYPLSEINPYAILFWVLPFLLAALMLLFSSRWIRKRRILQAILIISLTVLYLVKWSWWTVTPAFSGSLVYSETKDIANYMQIGAVEKDSNIIPILFPEEVPEHALAEQGPFLPDTTRYYNITEVPWDPRYELFAQWQLSNEDLEAEKERLVNAFSNINRLQPHILKNEDWVCWVFSYNPDDAVELFNYVLEGNPAKELKDYGCYCFAYRPRDGVVRYIASFSNGNLRVPIFMQLDWD